MSDTELWHAIYELYELLFLLKDNREDSYQEYFETHGVVFQVLGFDAYQSYEKKSSKCLPRDNERGYTPEPDFLCAEYGSATLTVFELKTPYVSKIIVQRADGNRKKLNAEVESYISQSTEYASSIRERQDARHTVTSDLQMEKISSYKICLVCGLEKENEPAEVSRLLDNRKLQTEVLYFDSLLDRLARTYCSTRPNTEGRDGLCVVYHLIFPPDQLNRRAFIADHGEEKSNRLSVYIENEIVFFQCIDSSGAKHELRSAICINQPLYLRFEFSNDASGIYMSLIVNNEERDLRVGSVPFDFRPNIRSTYIGANLYGESCGRFQSLHLSYYPKTMTLENRLRSFAHFKHEAKDSTLVPEFDGTSFLIRDPSGDLVSKEPGRAPTLRKVGYSDV